jgi:DNA ligase-1
MLKDPSSLYLRKRSEKLLKVKKFDNAEAIVIGHQRGEGRCIYMLGALIVKSCIDGQTFKVGSGFDDN